MDAFATAARSDFFGAVFCEAALFEAAAIGFFATVWVDFFALEAGLFGADAGFTVFAERTGGALGLDAPRTELAFLRAPAGGVAFFAVAFFVAISRLSSFQARATRDALFTGAFAFFFTAVFLDDFFDGETPAAPPLVCARTRMRS